MKRVTVNFIIDLSSFIILLLIALTGVTIKFILPPGTGGEGLGWRGGRALTADLDHERVKYFLGLHRHEWGDIHFYLAVAFAVLIIIHIILHWRWIKCMFGFEPRSEGSKTSASSCETSE